MLETLKQKFSGRFARNVGWIGIAEILTRVTRLLTAIVLARMLSPEEYGVVAIALTVYELVRVFTSNGLGAKIIQASDADLPVITNTAYRLNWLLNIALAIFQCAIAYPIADFYQNESLAPLLIALSAVYLIYPLGLVNVYLVQRSQRLQITALMMGGIVSLDNVLTAVLALFGFGIWAVVLPKLLVAPVWVLIYRRFDPWRMQWGMGMARWQEIFHFGKHVLGVELLKTLRMNIDNLIIGRFLGLEILGIYYFARNAGIGISMSVINAYSTAVLPHLAEAQGQRMVLRDKYLHALKMISLVVPSIILAQSLLAPWYVPLVFGESWVEAGAVPILILLCLSAIPRVYAESSSQLLRVLDKPALDFYWSLGFTALFTIAIFAGLPWQLTGVAVGILAIHVLAIPGYAYWVYWRFLGRNDPSATAH